MFPEAVSIILVVFAYGSSFTVEPQLRNFGGEETLIEEVPYIVSIMRHDIHVCGGTIIEKRWIITAAHCVEDKDDLQIQAGLVNLLNPGRFLQKIEVEDVFLHPFYVDSNVSFGYNIALLQLREDLEFNLAVEPISILSSNQLKTYMETRETALISGWGSSESAVSSVSDRLFSGKIDLLTNEACQEMFPDCEAFFPDANLCSSSWGANKLPGFLDDGGPIVLVGELGGLIIHGKRNKNGLRPILSTVYGAIPFHESFIQSHVPQLFSEVERQFPGDLFKERNSWKLDLILVSVPSSNPADGTKTFIFTYELYLPGSWDVTVPRSMFTRSLPIRCPKKNVVLNEKWILSIEIVESINPPEITWPIEFNFNYKFVVKLAKYLE